MEISLYDLSSGHKAIIKKIDSGEGFKKKTCLFKHKGWKNY